MKDKKALFAFAALLYVVAVVLSLSTLSMTLILGPGAKALFSENAQSSVLKVEEPFFESFSWIVDALTLGALWRDPALLPALFLGVGVVRFAMQVVHVWGWEWLSEKKCLQLREELLALFLRAPADGKSVSDAAQKDLMRDINPLFTVHIDHYKHYLVTVCGDFPCQVLQALMLVVMMAFIAPLLTLGMVLGVVPLVVSGTYFTKKISKRHQQEWDVLAVMGSWMEQCLDGIATIKHRRSEAFEVRRFGKKLQDLLRKQIRTKRTLSQSSPAGELISFAVVCLVFYVILRYRQELSLGVASLVTYISSMVFLSQNINRISKMVGIWGSGRAAILQIQEAQRVWSRRGTAAQREIVFLPPSGPSRVCLEVENLSFSYGDQSVLRDLSCRFLYGKIYAVVGRSGVGKTTFLKIIASALPATAGKITYYKSPDLSPSLVYMPQDFGEIPMSVAEGVAFPDMKPDLERVRRALQRAQVMDVLEEKDLSLESSLGISGSVLSGGEQQRISLSRIFYHGGAVLIADELSSALDSATENKILLELKKQAQRGACVITVAHRKKVIQWADEVVSLEGPVDST